MALPTAGVAGKFAPALALQTRGCRALGFFFGGGAYGSVCTRLHTSDETYRVLIIYIVYLLLVKCRIYLPPLSRAFLGIPPAVLCGIRDDPVFP